MSLEEARASNLVHGVYPKQTVEDEAWQQLQRLIQLPPEAFAETKRVLTERFCARIRAQMSSRVARQVEIWRSPAAQKLLYEAAARLTREHA